jgi:YD repeat-containing protein
VSSCSYNSSNQLVSSSAGSYTYDANGNTLTDPSGKQYTWDFENRLAQVVVPGTGAVTFKYDPFGRRIYMRDQLEWILKDWDARLAHAENGKPARLLESLPHDLIGTNPRRLTAKHLRGNRR